MTKLSTSKSCNTQVAGPAPVRPRNNADSWALERLEPRLLLAADLGVGLDVSAATDREAPIVSEVFDELSDDNRRANLQSQLSLLAGAIRQDIATESAAPLNLTELGGLLSATSAVASVDTSFSGLTEKDAGEAIGSSVNQSTAARTEIVFIDARVEDHEQLLADLELHTINDRQIEIHLLGPGTDGVAQISSILVGHRDLGGVHILSHGAAGQIQLGSATLSSSSLDVYAGQLNDWGSALADSGDILIYGCDLAADAQGEALVNAIGIMTGADVAASVDQTGHVAQGGNWQLEYQTGQVETTAAFGNVEQAQWMGVLATAITHQEVQTGSADNSTTVTTFASLTGATGDFYLATISSADNDPVSSVSGLGLIWTLIRDEGRNLTSTGHMEVWQGTGTPSGDGTVTATFSTPTVRAVMSVHRYAGVDLADPVGNSDSRNSGGTASDNYTFSTLDTTEANSVVFVAVDNEHNVHAPGVGYTERVEFFGGTGPPPFGLAVEDQLFAIPTVDLTVSGTFQSPGNWAVVAVELKVTGLAVDDTATTNEDTAVVIDVDDNDSGGLTTLDHTLAANGTLADNGDGTFTYTPDANYSGADSFDYLVTDGSDSTTHYWRLDGNAVDRVGSNDGTLVGSPITVAGHYGEALHFNGTNDSDYVSIPDFAYAADMTVSFRFKVDDNSGNLFQYFYSHDNAGTVNSLNIYLGETGNATYPDTILTYIRDINDTTGASALNVDVGTGGLNLIGDGQWHSYILTIENGVGSKVYIDGVQRSSSGRGGDGLNPAASLILGAPSTFSGGRYYAGDLDSVQIIDQTLDPAGVANLHSGTSSAQGSATVDISVDPVNDAPTISVGTFNLGSIDEETTSTGVRVSTIVGGLAAGDPDGNTVGMAVIAASGNGTWQYSTDSTDGSDGDWTDFGSVANDSALLLADTSWVRYQPDSLNGENVGIDFHAWDGTSGSASTTGAPFTANPDGGGGIKAFSSATPNADLTVTALNDTPVLGAIGDQSIDELATLTFTATATDSDLPADSLGFSLDAASIALGMSIAANSGAFSWTPTEGQGGLTPSVTVTVTDDGTGNLIDSETFTITVNDVNVAPVLGAIGDQSVDEGATLTFTATATDSDLPADILSFSLDAASVALGMSIDANTGAFSWTPTESQGGLTPSVTVTVTDNGTGTLVDSETFTITVNDLNTAPVLVVIGDQSIDELATLSFTATATDFDLPADTLTFSLDAASIAAGMSITAGGDFSWTPTEGQGGTTPSVTITVTDDGTGNLIDSETFTITVNDVNVAPVLGAIGDQSIDELATLTFTATATDSDLPADTLTFSLDAASIALGMSIDANTGAFNWTPTEGQGGLTPSVTITVTDDGTGNLVDSETFTGTVNDTNIAPVLGAIGDQSIDEGATLSFTATATDSDLPADTLSFSLDATSIALGMSIDANTGAFNWTPTEGQGGLTPSVTITVTDDGTGNLVDSETFTVTVNDTNIAPVLGAIGDQSIDELATLTFTATATDSDLPADTLSFSLDAASLALGMTIDANTGAFSWTPTEGQGGLTPSVTVTVTDDGTGNLVDSETFTITVNDVNVAPVLDAIGGQSVDELATLSFTATATDSDLPADTLSFSLDAASLALGMMIDANTGAFSWTPTEAQGGATPSVTLTVTDSGTGNLVDSETFTITVNDLNSAPVLGAIGDQSVDEGATLSFTATATDGDLPSDTLTFTLDAASIVLGMSIDASTGVFNWTPTEGQGGLTPPVTVTVTDDGTGTLVDSETFAITVNDVNVAPVLGAIGDQSIDELATLGFTATATDVDLPADTLSFSLDAASIALGMSIDANSGVFSWTPTEAQGGTAPSVTVTVTDNGTGNLVDSETFAITVNDLNSAPVLGAIGDQSIDELATLSFTATATDSDLPADTLSFSLDAASIALGMTIDANTGAFSWTPTESQGGLTPSVTVTVTDDGTGNLVDSETFTITVNDVNVAPVLGAIGDQSIDEGATLSFTATATDGDLPADTLSFSLDAASIALGMSIDANSGAFSWTPTEGQGGLTPSVTVTATDDGTGNLIDSETFTITVNDLNTAPVITSDGSGASASLNLNENSTVVTTVTASDSDLPADTLTYSISGGADQTLFSINGSGVLTFNTAPDFELPGDAGADNTYEVIVQASDGTDTDTQTITVTIDNIVSEGGPLIDNAATSVAEDAANTTVVYDLNDTNTANDTDTDAEPLTYAITAGNGDGIFSIDSGIGVISVLDNTNLDYETTPQYILTIEATDGVNIDTADITIDVTGVNEAPVLGAIGDQSVNELATLTFNATATDSDLPPDTLTFSLDAASIALGMTIGANTGAFSWTPTESQGGLTPSVTVTVTDDGTGNLVDSETFTITVNDTNTAPVLGAIGDQSVDEGLTLTFTATATDSDLPADRLTFSLDAASLALGMSIDANTGAFSWTPTEAQGGLTPSVTVTVTDDGTGNLVDSETFTITVNDTNTAPVLGAIGDQSVDELATLSFTATATDSDIPVDTLTFSLDAASIAAGMSISVGGDFSWTPTEGQGGTAPLVTITVTDSGTGNLVDSETFTITVNDMNIAPVLDSIGDQSVDELVPLTFTATASDSDLPADTLTFSLDAASIAAGMSITAGGDFSWTPTEGQGGTAPSVTITVTDSGTGNLVDSETFTITVNDVNAAPVLDPIGDRSVDELATLSFTATATDSDLPADSLTFSLDVASIAAGMSITAGGDFSWTPTEGQGGTAPSMTITVTDSGTGSLVDSETFTITVNDVNVAPVLDPIGDQSIDELSSLTFTATASDSDLPADSLTFALDPASIALGMSITAGGDFNWTPSEAQGGTAPSVTITVTDSGTGNLVDSETFTITVNDLNTAPVITSDGGGASASLNRNENSTVVTTVSASDSDLPVDTLTYSISGGADQTLFSINGSGVLTFNTAPDFELPGDAGADNTYEVIVQASDGTDTDTQTITVTIDNIVSEGGPLIDDAATSVAENAVDTTAVYDLNDTNTGSDTDKDAEPLTYAITAGNGDGIFSIDSGIGVISVLDNTNLDYETTSQYILTIEATDGVNIDTADITIDVTGVNEAPVLGAIGDQSVNELATLTFNATATDSDLPPDTLTFSLDAASIALGMSIDANTGAFSWTPTESQGGLTPSVTVTVTDNGTGSLVDSETFTITVNDLNSAPVLGAIGDQSVDELATLTFIATATDSDLPADTLSFSLDAASIAAGMSITAGGDFSWTPAEGQGGTTPSVTITVTDSGSGNLIDSETFTITVNDVNVAPVLDPIGAQSVDELATLNFTATATDSDVPVDTLTFSLDAASIAAGMSITAGGDFSWTPTEGQGGTTPSVTITVTDSGTGNLVDSETFTIIVNEVNIAPVLGAIGDQSIDELATLSFAATATDFDLPADTLTFSLDAASIAAGMSITAGGDFSWTPTEGQGGTAPLVTITVTDSGSGNLIDSETFTITVNDLNTAPVITSDGSGASASLNLNENSTVVTTVTASDSDLPADTLTYSISGGADQTLFSINASGVLTFNTAPDFELPGDAGADNTYEVIVQASDGTDTDTQTITVTIDNIVSEGGPLIDDATTSVAEDAVNTTVVYDLNDTNTGNDTDTDAEPLTYSITAGNGDGIFSIDSGTGVISVLDNTNLDYETTPQYILTIEATDGINIDMADITIDVTGVNEAPVLGAIGDQSVNELATLTFNATATDSDLPADTPTFSLDGASLALGMTIDANTGAFNWTPTEGQGGLTPSVTVTVTDDGTGNLIDSETFTITVNDVNVAPVLGAIGDQSVDELATLTFTVKAADSDLPADTLSFSLDAPSLALGMTIDANTGAFSWTPTEGQGGLTPSVTVTATDDGAGNLIDSETFTITVNELNSAPVIISDGAGATAAVTAAENQTDVTIVSTNDADLPTDALTYTIVGGADQALFSINSSGVLTFNSATDFEAAIDANTDGVYEVKVRVSDGTDTDTQQIAVTVTDLNDAPLLGIVETDAVSYSADDTPVAVTLMLTVDDQDDTHIEWAVVKFAAKYRPGEDILRFTDTGNIKGTWDAASGTLTLAGTDTLAAYQWALRSVSYENTSNTPDPGNRRITLMVDDGDANSNVVSRDLVLVDGSVADPPPVPTIKGPSMPTVDSFRSRTDGEAISEEAVSEGEELGPTNRHGARHEGASVASVASDDERIETLTIPIATAWEWGADAPVSTSDRTVAVMAKPSVAVALERYVAETIETNADLLEKLVIAPKEVLLNSIAGAVSIQELQFQLSASNFTRDLDRIREELGDQAFMEQVAAGTALASSTSLAVGYVMWLFRGGALLSGFLSSMAAWQLADPLPILAHSLAQGRRQQHDDGDSLESLVQEGSKAARDKRGKEDEQG